MNLLADEGVDGPIVERLRREGHRVIYIAELSPGIPDPDILKQANDDGALLMKADKDFGELVYRQRLVHAGVILLRLAGPTPAAKANVVAATIKDHGPQLVGAFSVVSQGTVRIRRGP
jgi:predicted nuclease of predicted toxin-antitoxin system